VLDKVYYKVNCCEEIMLEAMELVQKKTTKQKGERRGA
jgi:hypothetical protein